MAAAPSLPRPPSLPNPPDIIAALVPIVQWFIWLNIVLILLALIARLALFSLRAWRCEDDIHLVRAMLIETRLRRALGRAPQDECIVTAEQVLVTLPAHIRTGLEQPEGETQ